MLGRLGSAPVLLQGWLTEPEALQPALRGETHQPGLQRVRTLKGRGKPTQRHEGGADAEAGTASSPGLSRSHGNRDRCEDRPAERSRGQSVSHAHGRPLPARPRTQLRRRKDRLFDKRRWTASRASGHTET